MVYKPLFLWYNIFRKIRNDMKTKNGRIVINDKDLESFEARGFEVSKHTEHYFNGITSSIGEDFQIGLHCYKDSMECWVSGKDESIFIQNDKHAESLLKLMDAINDFNSFS